MPENLALLEILCSVQSKFVMYVVDRLQILGNRSDRKHTRLLQQVIYCLCSHDRGHEGLETLTKVCFTANGYVDALAMAASSDAQDKIVYEYKTGDRDAEDARMMGDVDFK